MEWCFRKVFEYKDKIELFERKLNMFQECDLDFVESDEERWVDKVERDIRCNRTLVLKGTLSNDNSWNGMSTSTVSPVCVQSSQGPAGNNRSNAPRSKLPLQLIQ